MAEEEVLDRAETLARMDNDFDLLVEITNLFLEDYPKLLSCAREALAAADAKGVEKAAHALKGSVSNFGAKRPFESAYRLEMMGRKGDLSSAPEVFAALEAELAALRPALIRLVTTGKAA